MKEFILRHASSVIGILSGFDRVLFRGTLRRLANVGGLLSFLNFTDVLLKDFGAYCETTTEQIKAASTAVMENAGRPVKYLPDPSVSKEEVAREIAERDRIKEGPICMLSAVEPCPSFEIRRDRALKKLVLQPKHRRCLHLYHYMIHPQMGFMHARLQTWLPYNISVCINGREWLSRQLNTAGIGYRRRENCFIDIANIDKAQALMDEQLSTDWPTLLGGIQSLVHPMHEELFGPKSRCPIDRYWSVQQSEWATDVMFKSPKLLSSLYPSLIRQGIETLHSPDVLRFLGKKVPEGKNAHGCFKGQVISDLKDRPEGVRLKHTANGNSVKMYDKQGSVLRVETTVNQPREFKVYRGTEAEPEKKEWRPLRKGVADMHRRAEVSQASNARYLGSMATVEQTTTVGECLTPLCVRAKRDKLSARALRPFDPDDMQLLAAVSHGEFTINGFRNHDIRELLFGPDDAKDAATKRRRSGQITRKLRMLRAHGLIKKVPKTHRYQLTAKGTTLATLLSAAKDADTKRLTAIAA